MTSCLYESCLVEHNLSLSVSVSVQDPPACCSLFRPRGVRLPSAEPRSPGQRGRHTLAQDTTDDGSSKRTDQYCGSVHALTHSMSTRLWWLSDMWSSRVAEVLVSSAKADLTLQDAHRNTALHLACSKVTVHRDRKCYFLHWSWWIMGIKGTVHPKLQMHILLLVCILTVYIIYTQNNSATISPQKSRPSFSR